MNKQSQKSSPSPSSRSNPNPLPLKIKPLEIPHEINIDDMKKSINYLKKQINIYNSIIRHSTNQSSSMNQILQQKRKKIQNILNSIYAL